MKSLLVTILLLVFPFIAGPHELLAKTASTDSLACSISHWPPDSIVSVYFIRGGFTPEQRQALIHEMGSSEETARKMGISVTFSYAGETDGLIDCEGCLTIARHEGNPTDRKARTSFNALRRNERGQLTSAWIGIEQGSNNSSGLRALKFETERGVRGTKILSVCRG